MLGRYLSEGRRRELRLLALVGLMAWLMSGITFPLASLAQDDPDLPAEAAPAEDGGAAATPASGEESLLEYVFNSLGWIYTIAFLALSFTFVALIVMNCLTLRREMITPMQLIEGFEMNLNDKKYQEAYDLARGDESFLGRVLAAGLAKLSPPGGYAQAIEAMQEVGEEETMRLEHRLSYIALIGTVSPMVGLLGTVHGMVDAFRVIARSTTQPKPSELAQGISMALVTTVAGLLLAIPAVGFFGIMRNQLARLTLEVGRVSEGLMSRFSSMNPKKS